jgi:hypothetical protein
VFTDFQHVVIDKSADLAEKKAQKCGSPVACAPSVVITVGPEQAYLRLTKYRMSSSSSLFHLHGLADYHFWIFEIFHF